jgi:hypothetical protein
MNAKKALRVVLLAIILASALVFLFKVSSRAPVESTSSPGNTTASESTDTTPDASRRPWEANPKTRRIAGPPVFAPKAAPQKLEVEWHGTWYPAEILSSSGASNLIRYVGYGPEWDEWISAERMRYSPAELSPSNATVVTTIPFVINTNVSVRMTPSAGDLVVKWGSAWWRAEVLKTEGDKSLIRYVGYNESSDEWVTPDRIKTFTEQDAKQTRHENTYVEPVAQQSSVAQQPYHAPELQAPQVQGSPAKGELLVQWGGQWWPAEVLKTENGRHFIRYKGYDSHWDEWVTNERMGVYEGD